VVLKQRTRTVSNPWIFVFLRTECDHFAEAERLSLNMFPFILVGDMSLPKVGDHQLIPASKTVVKRLSSNETPELNLDLNLHFEFDEGGLINE
jgi:hypothetical protein